MVKYKHSGVGGQFTTMLSLVHIQVCRHCMADEGGRVQKNFVKKKFLSKKKFWPKKNFGPKKYCGPKKFLVKKHFWSKHLYGSKKLLRKKVVFAKKWLTLGNEVMINLRGVGLNRVLKNLLVEIFFRHNRI